MLYISHKYGRTGALLALLGFCLLVQPACRIGKNEVHEKVVTKDSLVDRLVEVIKYVPHTVPGDTVTIVYQLPCDEATGMVKNGNYAVSGKRSKVKIDIKDGVITATAICNELRDSIAAKNTLIAQLSKSQRAHESIERKDVTKTVTPWWAKWALGISLASIGFAGYRLYRCVRNKINPLSAFVKLLFN